MRVLGVDPGLTRCGVGIIDGAVGSPLSLVEVGVILTPVDAPLEQRLLDLDQQLSQWIPVMMHTPSEVKASVTGNGRANKAQVAMMVQKILNLDSIPKPVDATDALALAICNIWRGGGST